MNLTVGPVRPELSVAFGRLNARGDDNPDYLRSEDYAGFERNTYGWMRVEGGLWYAF